MIAMQIPNPRKICKDAEIVSDIFVSFITKKYFFVIFISITNKLLPLEKPSFEILLDALSC